MQTWTKLIHYHLIMQAFCDCPEICTADSTMCSLVETHAFLHRIYPFPLWQRDFKVKPTCIQGTYRKTEKWHKIQHDGRIGPIRITRKTKLEDGLQEGDGALIFCQQVSGGYEASMIISQQVYDTMHYLSGEWEKLEGVANFLMATPRIQDVIRWLMFSNENARSVLWFLSYVVGFCMEGKDCSSDSDIEAILLQFNHLIAHKHECLPLPADKVEEIIDLMGIRVDLASDMHWTSDPFVRFLGVFALVNKISPWSEECVAKTLIDRIPCRYVEAVSSYLPHLCGRDSYHLLMRDMLARSSAQTYAITNAEHFLFESLAIAPFESAFVKKACDVLFSHSIADCHVSAMDRILTGPNGQIICEYIFAKVKEGLSVGRAQYHFAAAAIQNAQDYQCGLHPFKTAVEQAKQPTPEDFLIGTSRISLLLWTQNIARYRIELKKEFLADEVIDALLDQLQHYDARYYAAAASAIHDIIVAGWLMPDILKNQRIKNTAIATLNATNGCGWAEKILAFMPWDGPGKECGTDAICNAYKTRLDAELSSSEHEANPEVTFGVLAALGYWENKPWEMRLQLERVEKYYNKYAHLVDKGQAKRLRLLRSEAKKL